jgi:hypothetical protein
METWIPEGLFDAGEVEFDYQYDPALSVECPICGPSELMTITLPKGQTITFNGFVTKDGGEIPMKGLMTGSATLCIADSMAGTALPYWTSVSTSISSSDSVSGSASASKSTSQSPSLSVSNSASTSLSASLAG